ncbi:MAG: heme-binding protein [Lutibacter sp.]|nr:heme-binding protein [Lutibacter sp.]MBP9601184.1 heme-binding protein [Lutibacter sp.]
MHLKKLLLILVFPTILIGQSQSTPINSIENELIKQKPTLTLNAAFELTKRVQKVADSLNTNVSLTILDASGVIILQIKEENVGPHNTEASRRKAYTSLSTKTPTLQLLRTIKNSPDSQNLAELPELLLLSGGCPIYWNEQIVGSIGIAGGGSAEKDDLLAKSAQILEVGIKTSK